MDKLSVFTICGITLMLVGLALTGTSLMLQIYAQNNLTEVAETSKQAKTIAEVTPLASDQDVEKVAADSFVSLITAISGFILAITGIATAVLAFLSSHIKNKKVVEEANRILQLAAFGAKKTIDNQDKIRNVTLAVQELNPEVKQYLQKHQVAIDETTNQVQLTKDQVMKLVKNLPIDLDLTDTDNNGIPDIIDMHKTSR